MRPGPWLLLFLLLSSSAAARDGSGGLVLQMRRLVLPSRPEQVPPLELHVAAGVATRVEFEPPLRPEFPVPADERIQFGRLGDGSLILVPTTRLAPGERVLLTVAAEASPEPLRFALVTRRGVVDVRVQVARALPTADEEGAEFVARSLLAAPDARATLAVPQEVVELESRDVRARVESVLWMGRRLFATVAMRSIDRSSRPWVLKQARFRAELADGLLLEWPVRILSGGAGAQRGLHVLTGVLPEGASSLEVALDGEDAPGRFRKLPLDGRP